MQLYIKCNREKWHRHKIREIRPFSKCYQAKLYALYEEYQPMQSNNFKN